MAYTLAEINAMPARYMTRSWTVGFVTVVMAVVSREEHETRWQAAFRDPMYTSVVTFDRDKSGEYIEKFVVFRHLPWEPNKTVGDYLKPVIEK